MIKKIIFCFSLLLTISAFAQEGTSSPYSYYGIGDVMFKGTIENRTMGSISVFPDSTHVNFQNPSQLASLKLSSFAIGGTYLTTKSKSDDVSSSGIETKEGKARRTRLDYLAVGLPMGKLGVGFGLIPYSSVGYKLQTLSSDSTVFSKYNGAGGINKVFLGLGYKLSKNFSIGADLQYNFGKIETSSAVNTSGVQYGTREVNSSDIEGVNFNTAISVQSKISKKLTYFGSLMYSPQTNLNLSNSRLISLVELLASGAYTTVDTLSEVSANKKIKLPSKFVFGSGFGEVKKWLVGAEVTLQNSSVMSNRFDDIEGVTFENSVRYSLGGYFIPNYNSYSNYFKRVTYRAGMRYEKMGMILKEKSLDDFAITLGAGLPAGGSFSSINICLEIGKRGTQYFNLIQENYVNLSIGLSLSEKWFQKRKYD